MATTHVISTLGIARANIQSLITNAAKEAMSEWKDIFNMRKTTQEFFQIKTLTGLGYPEIVNEGSDANLDSRRALYSLNVYPKKRMIALRWTGEAKFTDQYGEFSKLPGMVGKSMAAGRALAAANIFNNAFDTTNFAGIDTVSLCHTAHPTAGGPTWSNRPSSDVAFSEAAVTQALQEMRTVDDPRNLPMSFRGRVKVLVPPSLEFAALKLENSTLVPGSMDNDANVVKSRIKTVVLDDLSSTTAWFCVAEAKDEHGLIVIDRRPIWVKTDEQILSDSFIFASGEEYAFSWEHPYRVWGTTG